MLKARTLLLPIVALLLAVGAVQAMTFVAPFSHPVRTLAPAFVSHPDALTNRAMAEIGTAARRGDPVPLPSRQAMASVARIAPLAPDPFLVEGTIAEMAGDALRSERLFLAARGRNPRSQAARYFLADRYLKTNRILPGLVELGALARMSERASQPLVPALAAYARSPGAVTQLRRYFKAYPAVRDNTLALLAEDSRNASLILSLAPRGLNGTVRADWQGRLIQSLIRSGEYAAAEALWSRTAGVADRGLLFNPNFRASTAPPPFNWQYSTGFAGVAEPSGSGGLDVIYYGRADVTLVSQLLRLAPGRYRLAMRVKRPSRSSRLRWNISCLPSNKTLIELPFGTLSNGPVAGDFVVSARDCPAQALELRGRPGDSIASEQHKISSVSFERLAVAP